MQDPGLVAAGQGTVLTRRPEGAMGGSSYQNRVAEIAGRRGLLYKRSACS